MFEQSINLKEPWRVVKAEFDERDKAVHVYVEGRKTAEYKCPVCGKKCKRYDNEDEERVWRHADVVLYPCYIHCRRPRIKCGKDGIHVVDAPWAKPYGRFTLAFEAYAMLLAQNMSLNEARKILRVSRGALFNIVEYWVERGVEEQELTEISRLTIDETSFKKGHKYVTVVGDPVGKRVIGVEEGRDVEAVEKFSIDFEKRGGNCEEIKEVTMDMSPTYKQAKELCFPNACIVLDKFHVKQRVLKGLDEVRRDEQGKKFSKSWQSGRRLLMIPLGRMTEKQKAKQISLCKEYPKTGRCFQMVQQLDDFYKCTDIREAEEVFKRLTSWMMRSRLEPMKKVAKSLRKHKKEIFTYFINRTSNAFAEGINSLIQTGKRKARGFRTFKGFRIMTFLTVGKLTLSYPKVLFT